ncbi:sigma-70 family RNA polymerase sigma factor [Mesorhizobium sp. BAC0120]|uniref:sigma-70 family RNA polymerase sigma factor n=1 Tax=Mesorhizobium sp. BAC0120 TaxID=3090670 RepID=UPI00298CF17F|nr:sigma-70 family RNA polymerase sigma factor [Mesorhizobium sp. BAC0120]MDW6021391.1 sigma-70 family RNA polymerase sigma factor [Mesorhizobium sp. BAC0120]
MNAVSGTAWRNAFRRSARFEKRRDVSSEAASERFKEVVLPHLADAMALARWLTGNQHDAEDVVQDACVRALAGIDGYSGRGARAWLLAIVRNSCFAWLAKNRPKSLVLVGDLAAVDEIGQSDDAEPALTPEAELIRKADAMLVRRALETLPIPFREVLVLRDINELSYKEIAAMLAVPIGTVMSRLSRGRGLLAIAIERAR